MKPLFCALLLSTALIAAPALGPALAQHAGHGSHAAETGAAAVQVGDLHLSGAFARATLPRAPVAGAYLTIMNHGADDDRLISATAPVSNEVQIHTMDHKDGVMTMRQLPDGLPIPAGETVVLEPGGLHLMLMGLTGALEKGQSVTIELVFERAGAVPVTFDIRALNARSGAAGGHGAADGHAGHAHAAPGHSGHGHGGHSHAGHGHAGHAAHGAATFDQASVQGDEARITGLLQDMFQTPEAPLTVAPVLIDGDLAVIGWSQDGNGGRALLRRDDQGLWRVSLCAGDGLRGEANLIALGVDAPAAARLAAAQAQAEAALPPEQVARFALFEGVLHVDSETGH